MTKPVKSGDKTKYFNDATNWDERNYADAIKARATNKKIAWVGAMFGLIGCASTFFLLPLKTFVPTVIRVDSQTGSYDVDKQGQHIDIKDKRNEKIIYTDLRRYVDAKEGFTRGEAQKNYNIAYLMSCNAVRGEVMSYFLPDNNPASPLVTMQLGDTDSIEIQNITFLPSDLDDIKVAQVRFDKTIERSGIKKSKTRYISTITFKYDNNNVPTDLNDMTVNAFGFCAENYRRDQEGKTIDFTNNVPVVTEPTTSGVTP